MTVGAAERWERRVQLVAHPIAYPLLLAAARQPVRRLPRVGVLVADARLAREVLLDNNTFTKDGPGSPADLWTPVVGPSVLLNMEGPAHTDLRRRLGPLFTPAAVTALCAATGDDLLRDTVDRLAHFEAVDLVQVTRDLAGSVICSLVGLPVEKVLFGAALDAATRITAGVRLARRGLTTGQATAARSALAELTDPARAAWRKPDTDTVPGRMRALGLTEDEAIGAVAAFILVGTETLISYLPRLLALAIDSGHWSPLATDEDLLEPLIAEGLRFTVPSPVMLRSVACHGRIGPVTVGPGDRVVIATAVAARTQRRFDPSTAAAADLRQLWFGAGSHFCLGMPLAMAEIRLVLAALLAVERHHGPLRILRRSVRRRTLIPGYRQLVIGRG